MYQASERGKMLCLKCPRNTYSRAGGTCTQCPEDATWKGSNGGPGKGCFCLHGSDRVDGVSKELIFFAAMAAVTLGGLFL